MSEFDWNAHDLKIQFDRVVANNWLDNFKQAEKDSGIPTKILMAIASRETNIQNIKGDYHDGIYHGYSMFQFDIRSHGSFINTGDWEKPALVIAKAAAILKEKQDYMVQNVGNLVTVKDHKGQIYDFIMPKMEDSVLLSAVIACWNCGLWSCYHIANNHDVDRGTAHQNYSKDVLARADLFDGWINPQPKEDSNADK